MIERFLGKEALLKRRPPGITHSPPGKETLHGKEKG